MTRDEWIDAVSAAVGSFGLVLLSLIAVYGG